MFEEIVNKVFPYWIYQHPRILYSLIRAAKPKVVVEVGTMYGYAAAWMAQALKQNGDGMLYSIDDFSEDTPHPSNPDAWDDNLRRCGVREFATLIVGDSRKVEWPKSVDFAYIDGWHGYQTCMLDFRDCAKRGADTICSDDTTGMIGPRMLIRGLREGASTAWDVAQIWSDNGMAICTRRRPWTPPTFSQELPQGITSGVDLTKEDVVEHLRQASKLNKLQYEGRY